MRRAVAGWGAALVISGGLLALPLVALAATSAVNIQGFAFVPSSLTITVGDSVTWTNRDAAAHSAKFSDRSTAVLSQGQSGTLQFTVAGTFPYICGIHGASMQGTIVVQAVTTPQPTAPPTPVRTPPPTIAPTARPTAASTETPTVEPTTAAPSATPSPRSAPSETASAPASAVAAQVTPAPTASGGGTAPLLIGAAVLAVLALSAIAFFLARRS